MQRIYLSFVLLLVSCGGAQPATKAPPAHEPPQAEHRGHNEHHHHEHHHAHEYRHAGPVGHRFVDAEKWAKRFDAKERDAWQKPREVIALMQIADGMTVADIGAGTGYFLPYLSEAVKSGQVIGLDVEEDMVRYMKERAQREGLANVTAHIVDVRDPGLAPNSTDRILIVNTWHHIGDRKAYAQKLASTLTEAGQVIIVDFTMETHRGPPKSHRLSPETILQDFEESGLRARVVEETLPDQFVIVAGR